MSIIELNHAFDVAGSPRRLLINSDAIAFVDATDDWKIIKMKTGESYRVKDALVGIAGDGKGHYEIFISEKEGNA